MAKKSMAAHGCLLLHDLTAAEAQMADLCSCLEDAGYPASVPNLFGFTPRDAYDRTPMWQRWLTQAQEAYVELRGVSEKVTVIGAGNGGVIATVIAEQYSVDGLIVLGCVSRPTAAAASLRRWLPFVSLEGAPREVHTLDIGRLVRLANNNLFSIVGDVLVVQAMNDALYSPRGGEQLLAGVRSGRRESLALEGATVADMCRTHAPQIREAVLGFLRGMPAGEKPAKQIG